MKPSIRVLTLALAFVMMLGLSGVGHAAAEADRSITVTENWTFDAGFYPVLSPSTSTNYGIAYWTRNFYQTLSLMTKPARSSASSPKAGRFRTMDLPTLLRCGTT